MRILEIANQTTTAKMKNNPSYRLLQSIRDNAMLQGESIAEVLNIRSYPIDVFSIIRQEPLIYAEGDDFGDDFDGRLEYLGASFLLAYNTKYNRHQPNQRHLHPRVRFTIAHELGHFYIESHRQLMQHGQRNYSCVTEGFPSEKELEIQADYFATGLLMPTNMLSPLVNKSEPDKETIKRMATDFQVSLTSMMLRWVKLSHFPCGLFSVDLEGNVLWGWVSEALARIRAYRKRDNLQSNEGTVFLKTVDCTQYQDGTGQGLLNDWVNIEHTQLSVQEDYYFIPARRNMLVFIRTYEDEILALDN
jgi:hypothetical protein